MAAIWSGPTGAAGYLMAQTAEIAASRQNILPFLQDSCAGNLTVGISAFDRLDFSAGFIVNLSCGAGYCCAIFSCYSYQA